MKNIILTISLCIASYSAYCQDEGVAVAQDRLARSKSIYIGAGPALTLGKNLGDYGNGFGFGGGYLKRLNKVLSIGGSISYLNFKYDEYKTYPYYYDPSIDAVLEYFQKGGDVNLLSLGFDIKLNFVPVGDNTMFSLYGIASPFVSKVSRKEFTARGDVYIDFDGDGLYTDGPGTITFVASGSGTNVVKIPELAEDSKISGGMQLGFGAELFPSKAVSLFFQATFCYTLPISYSATESFLKKNDQYVDDANVIYYDFNKTLLVDGFPIVNKGFSALNLKVGVSFNF